MSHPARITKFSTLYWPKVAKVVESDIDKIAQAAHEQYKLVRVEAEDGVEISGEVMRKQFKITGTNAAVENPDAFGLHTTLCYGGLAVPMHRYIVSIILDHNNGARSADASAGGIHGYMLRQIDNWPNVRVRREMVSTHAGSHHFTISADEKAEVQRFASLINDFIGEGKGSESIIKPLLKIPDANMNGTLTALGWVHQQSSTNSYHWKWSPRRKAVAKGPLKPLAKVHGIGKGGFIGPSDSRLDVPQPSLRTSTSSRSLRSNNSAGAPTGPKRAFTANAGQFVGPSQPAQVPGLRRTASSASLTRRR